MFQFSSNTIINSLTDPAFANVPTSAAGGADIKSHSRFWVETATDPILRIAKHFQFKKSNVEAIYKREYADPVLFKATIDLTSMVSATTDTVGRIALYIRLSGSNNSYYSNDFVFKGKPFYIEFPIKAGEAADVLATKIVKIAKKYQSTIYEEPLLNVYAGTKTGTVDTTAANNTALVIEGIDEYQTIQLVKAQLYNDTVLTYGAFEDKVDGTILKQGKEGFGTYRRIIKDLRLPTAANTRFFGIARDEMPLLGGKYDEYIIDMCTNRGVLGTDAVGDVVQSKTTHVFYVLQGDVSNAFKTALDSIGTIVTVDKDADDVSLSTDTIEEAEQNPAKTIAAEGTAHGPINKNTGE